MIEKLVKEFEKIYASLGRSKKLILADIDKIDEKYRKLAQEEKKNLTESLAVLNEQMKYYSTMLGNKTEEAQSDEKSEYVEPDPIEEVPELKIQDTIFPENNVEEEKTEETTFETTYPEKEDEHKEETKTVEESDAADVVPADSSVTADDVTVGWPSETVQEEKKGLTKEEIVAGLEAAGMVDVETVVKKEEEEPIPVFETNDDGWPIPDDWK